MNRVKCKGGKQGLAFLVLITVLLEFQSVAQPMAFIEGKVIDAETRKEISFATIFLANTTFGTSSLEDGSYRIENISSGKYDVIASSLGYKTVTIPITFENRKIILNIQLQPRVTELQEVVVDASNRSRRYRTFMKYFLGDTPNARKCVIKNPDDIYLSYDEKEKILTAQADKPIIIENHALGYRIFYLLDEFQFIEPKGLTSVFGIPKFEGLKAKNQREQHQWNRGRDEAYNGSVQHLMKSLSKRATAENKFSFYSVTHSLPIDEKSLFPDSAGNQLNFTGQLKIIYSGEDEDVTYQQTRESKSQQSLIKFTEPSITIYDNGYYENFKSIILNGYMAWSEGIGNMVPLGYQLSTGQ